MTTLNLTLTERPSRRRALALLGVGAGMSVLGVSLKPGTKTSAPPQGFDLTSLIPTRFGEWKETAQVARTVNPQTQALLDKIYSQILERVYQDASGNRIMLAAAYGADQRGSLEAHKPEVCYPAQGFVIKANQEVSLQTDFGVVAARRVFAVAGNRQEPLTYWFTMSNQQVMSRTEKRLVEIKSALTGQIPDGLLVRVSSISSDPNNAWAIQQRFLNDLLHHLNPEGRRRVAGLQA